MEGEARAGVGSRLRDTEGLGRSDEEGWKRTRKKERKSFTGRGEGGRWSGRFRTCTSTSLTLHLPWYGKGWRGPGLS